MGFEPTVLSSLGGRALIIQHQGNKKVVQVLVELDIRDVSGLPQTGAFAAKLDPCRARRGSKPSCNR